MGICSLTPELKLVLCGNLEQWEGVRGGREIQEGMDMCIPIADSCWCMAETNSIAKQFPLNYKQIKQESTYQCRRHRRCRFEPWVRRIPWRRKWQPTHVLAWETPWTEEPDGLQSMGLQRGRHDSAGTDAQEPGSWACLLTNYAVLFPSYSRKKRGGGVGKNNKIHGDFPGSPAVKTLSSQSWRYRFDP